MKLREHFDPSSETYGQLEPGARDVARRLLSNGASRPVIELALARIKKKHAAGMYAIDAAAEVLGHVCRFLPSPRRTGGLGAFAFVGPEGSGKTSALLRLAGRMEENDRRVLCGAVTVPDDERMRSRDLGLSLPFLDIQDGEEVERAIRRFKPDALLVDTPGLSPRDPRPLAALGAELRSLVPGAGCRLILVLPATGTRQQIRDSLKSFSALGLAGACLTHLDLAAEIIPAFEEIARARLPLAFLSGGRERAALWRPSVDRVADVFLRGRRAAAPPRT